MNQAAALWLIKFGGVASLGWLIFHLCFWRFFEWKTQLSRLNQLNRSVMQVLNLCLSFVFAVFAAASLLYADDLLKPGLGRLWLAGMGLFWLLRLIEQPLFFGVSRVSNVFSLCFALMSVCYLAPWALS